MSIPIEIILYALRHKKLSQLKLYLYLKHISSGAILLTDEVKASVCKELDWKDIRTFNNNLEWLLNHKWTALNSKTNSLRIASYKQVFNKINGKKTSGVRMETTDFKTFRPFIYAAAIKWSIKVLARKNMMSERIQGSSKMDYSKTEYNILPNEYFADIIHSDKSTASRYKNAAAKAKYIVIHHRLENLKLHPRFIVAMKQNLADNTANSLLIRGNKIYQQLPDLIYCKVYLVSLKRLKR